MLQERRIICCVYVCEREREGQGLRVFLVRRGKMCAGDWKIWAVRRYACEAGRKHHRARPPAPPAELTLIMKCQHSRPLTGY